MSIGEALAQARQRAGLSIDEVSEQTRIRPLIVRAIEADDYSVCGGDFYARGDIRSIARAVGADPGPLIDEYDMDHRATGPISATSINELLARSAAPPGRRGPGWLVAALAVVAAIGVGAWFLVTGTGGGGRPAATTAQHAAAAGAGSGRGGGAVNAHGAAPVTGRATAAPSGAPAAPGAGSASPSATPPATPPAVPLAPVSASAFGMAGPGTGDDPQGAGMVLGGHPGTAWTSDWYTTAGFGHLYPGTGLLLDMGHPVTVTAVRVRLGPAGGASFQIRVGSAPALASLHPVASSSGPGGTVRLSLGHPAQGRYVLVWFTRLPPDPAGTFQVSVYRVAVHGQG